MDEDYKVLPTNPYWGLIQEAYGVFRVPTPKDLEVCNFCCMPDDIQNEMKKYVSQNIPFHLMEEWYSAATNYPVSQNLWSYILPRSLEILATGNMPTHSLEIVLNRFPTGDRERWSKAQWQVLSAFQKMFIQTENISKESLICHHYLDDKICMFANAGWNVDQLFEQVYNLPIQMLVEKLYCDWIDDTKYPQIWVTSFWDDVEKIEFKWTAKVLHDRLLDYGMSPTSPKDLVDKALDLVDVISVHRNNWE